MSRFDASESHTVDIEVRLLLEAIFLRYHYDFRDYSRASVRRRLEHTRTQLGCASLSELQARVLRDPATFARLRDDLTVQVSEMFRDPQYFRALREHVVPVLATYPSIKVWVAGCSTGEEVYSLAILLHEEGLLDRSVIYATDINMGGLQAAQRGIYASERMADSSRNYARSGGKSSLSDFYTAAYDNAVFDRALRQRVVFSDHDLATDSSFAEVQLISCRNVLIYFGRALQDRAIGLFAESLCPMGFVGLGIHETLSFSDHASQFSEIAKAEKIYRKVSC